MEYNHHLNSEFGTDYSDGVKRNDKNSKDPREQVLQKFLPKGADYSLDQGKSAGKRHQQMGSILLHFLIKNEPIEVPKHLDSSHTMSFCKPPSLIKWQKKKNIVNMH